MYGDHERGNYFLFQEVASIVTLTVIVIWGLYRDLRAHRSLYLLCMCVRFTIPFIVQPS